LCFPAVLAVCLLAVTAGLSAGEPDHPPAARMRSVTIDAVRWTDGFWGDRFRLCQEMILPKMKEALLAPDNAAQLVNFRVAAGLEEGGHRGVNWSDGDCYKWIEAMAHVYALTGDEALDREMDAWIDLIARSQAADGYLGTQTQLNPKKDRWGARGFHELYNMGHLMTAAAVHHEATGKDSFLAVARKVGDYLYTVFEPPPTELAHFGWNPSNIMGLVDLYRATGERRYLELAGTFVDMRGSKPWPRQQWGLAVADDPNPGDQNQDRVALRKETLAVGHAVTGPYLYCGAADVYAETGDKTLLGALTAIWQDVTNRKMYVTGAIGAYHHGVSVRHDLVHEAFGREYELPNRTAYNETCANIANAMWNRRMLNITGEAKYADVMERVLYNSALSAMSIDGTRFCYCNPLARRHGAELLDHDTPQRWTTATCYCCPPSVARTIAGVNQWAYGLSDDAVWVHLYGGNVLDTDLAGGRLRLTQKTQYPWDGRVTITVEAAPSGPFAVRLRIPGWADGHSLTLDGKPLDAAPGRDGYVEIRRPWKPGATIELDLPMEVAMLEANPLVEEARNQVAVMRGPIVYCLESIGLAEGVEMDDVRLVRRPQWTARHEPGLLGGVTVLSTEGRLALGGEWDSLYRKRSTTEPRPIAVELIPYYAWNNRGTTEMTVWLPIE
jgi:hypothetical protein